jgi:hypothetical protein
MINAVEDSRVTQQALPHSFGLGIIGSPGAIPYDLRQQVIDKRGMDVIRRPFA